MFDTNPSSSDTLNVGTSHVSRDQPETSFQADIDPRLNVTSKHIKLQLPYEMESGQ